MSTEFPEPQIAGPEAIAFGLQPHVTLRQTNNGLVMLFDRAKGVMYELNETATAIVEMLSDNGASVAAMVDGLCEEFEAPRDELEEDVRQFIDEFSGMGLVTSEPGP